MHSKGLSNRLVCRSFCLSVRLSAPSQDFEQNRLVYGLYLLHMSQNFSLFIPHELEHTSGSRLFTFFCFVKTTFYCTSKLQSGDHFQASLGFAC